MKYKKKALMTGMLFALVSIGSQGATQTLIEPVGTLTCTSMPSKARAAADFSAILLIQGGIRE